MWKCVFQRALWQLGRPLLFFAEVLLPLSPTQKPPMDGQDSAVVLFCLFWYFKYLSQFSFYLFYTSFLFKKNIVTTSSHEKGLQSSSLFYFSKSKIQFIFRVRPVRWAFQGRKREELLCSEPRVLEGKSIKLREDALCKTDQTFSDQKTKNTILKDFFNDFMDIRRSPPAHFPE